MLNFREELRVKEEVKEILSRLFFYYGVNSIDELLNEKNILFVISGHMLYVREYPYYKTENKGLCGIFESSNHAEIALKYIEAKLKQKKYDMVKNKGRLYVRKKR